MRLRTVVAPLAAALSIAAVAPWEAAASAPAARPVVPEALDFSAHTELPRTDLLQSPEAKAPEARTRAQGPVAPAPAPAAKGQEAKGQEARGQEAKAPEAKDLPQPSDDDEEGEPQQRHGVLTPLTNVLEGLPLVGGLFRQQ
ncbi:hypothetical protein ACIHFE_09805 [Streptomyces sp. NPDC052396]|uniref:hypothetical protein n=1 Tax=Streptomyces sp. NPDC052396 TaxID=3365689 RepID=UPI0037CDDD98